MAQAQNSQCIVCGKAERATDTCAKCQSVRYCDVGACKDSDEQLHARECAPIIALRVRAVGEKLGAGALGDLAMYVVCRPNKIDAYIILASAPSPAVSARRLAPVRFADTSSAPTPASGIKHSKIPVIPVVELSQADQTEQKEILAVHDAAMRKAFSDVTGAAISVGDMMAIQTTGNKQLKVLGDAFRKLDRSQMDINPRSSDVCMAPDASRDRNPGMCMYRARAVSIPGYMVDTKEPRACNAHMIGGGFYDRGDADRYVACQAPFGVRGPEVMEPLALAVVTGAPIVVTLGRFDETISRASYIPNYVGTIGQDGRRWGQMFFARPTVGDLDWLPEWAVKHDISGPHIVVTTLIAEYPTGDKAARVRSPIVHVNYKDWPDVGIPDPSEKPEPLHKLIMLVNKAHQSAPDNPLCVVHCSAGVGRTGVFLSCLMFSRALLAAPIEQLEAQSFKFDFVELLKHLRERRYGMIHTFDQFLFVIKFSAFFATKRLAAPK